MPLIKPRTRGKQLVRHIARLDRETNETLYAYAHFLGEPTDYVLNQVIDTVLAKDKEFQAKTDKVLGGYPLLRGDRLEKTIQQAFQIDADTQRFVREWASKKYRVKFD